MDERSELALHLLADGSLHVERLVIRDKIRSQFDLLRANGNPETLAQLLQLCELVGEYTLALKLIRAYQPQKYDKLVSAMTSRNDSG